MSVSWNYYSDNPEIRTVNDMYLPATGEGDSLATQIVTAVNKLIYKWYNDGDVYDNRYILQGWANDLSDYANWLYKYTPAADILSRISEVYTESEYEDLLQDVADMLLDENWLRQWEDAPKAGSIYNCDGPFEFIEIEEEDDYYDDDYYDDEEDEDYY